MVDALQVVSLPNLDGAEIPLAMLYVFALFAACGLGLLRRGFSPWFVLSCICALLGVSAFIGAISYRLLDALPDQDDGAVARGTLGVAAVAMTALLGALWVLLPRRSPRTAGDRVVKFPVRGAAFTVAALLATAGIALAISTLEYPTGFSALQSALLCLVAAAAYVALGAGIRRQGLSARPVPDVLAKDERPPVLFLREFKAEGRPFAIGRSKDLVRLVHPSGAVSRLALRSLWFRGGWLSCELFLSGAVERDLGPLVALGNPEDHLQPLGAARTYSSDQAWTAAFAELTHRAQAVLLLAGVSTQVTWEMDHLLRHGMAGKLFVITDATTTTRERWPLFAAAARALGYELPVATPSPGALLGFDGNGIGSVLVGHATSPEEYTQAIRAHLHR